MQKIITDIEKNANEFIRAELSEFKGHDLFSFRVYADREWPDKAINKIECGEHWRCWRAERG